jgi:hypothetical protein
MSWRGREIEHLIDPLPLADFFREHWERKAVHIPGRPGKFADIYDFRDWPRRPVSELRAATLDERGRQEELHVQPDMIEALYRAGMTICANVSGDPMLAPFLAGFRRRMRFAGDPFAKLYASADGRGFALHHDAHHVFVLQLDGQKQWRYSATPAVPSAHTSVPGDEVDPAEVARFETALLSPGDCLYLPPGTWHVARAVGHSIAVSISPPRLPAFELVTRVLRELLAQRPEWRRDVLAAPDEAAAPGHLPASVEAELGARLGDLRKALDGLDPRVLHRAWRLAVGSDGPASTEPPGDLDEADVLVHRDGAPLEFLIAPSTGGSDEILFYERSTEWGVPIEALGFLTEMVKNREFRVRNALKWDRRLTWDDVRSLLLQMIEAGILERRGPRPE